MSRLDVSSILGPRRPRIARWPWLLSLALHATVALWALRHGHAVHDVAHAREVVIPADAPRPILHRVETARAPAPKPKPKPRPERRPVVKKPAPKVIAAKPAEVAPEAPVDFDIAVPADDAEDAPVDFGDWDPEATPAAESAGETTRARSVALRPGSWHCAWPSAAARSDIHTQHVILRVRTDAEGRVDAVEILHDPGQGFGEAAARCARRTRFHAARNDRGEAVAGLSPPVRVRFVR